MDVLTIVLIVLAVAAIWLVVELAVTARHARAAVDEAKLAVEEARPAIAHIDEVVTAAAPAVSNVDPLLGNAIVAVDALTSDLKRIDTILGDVSLISGKAGNATAAVGDAAVGIAGKARSLFSRHSPAAQPAPAIEPISHEALGEGGEPAHAKAADASEAPADSETAADAPEAAKNEEADNVTGDAKTAHGTKAASPAQKGGYFTYPQD